jgi:hypothetical protein
LERDNDEVQLIKKRKKEYKIKFDQSVVILRHKEDQEQKRLREFYPSDDESPKQPSSQPKKKKKLATQKVIEEEIISPRFSKHSFIPFSIFTNLVTSMFPDVPPVLISQILSTNTAPSHPLLPRKMRVQCRVRDIYPRSLADFAVPFCPNCQNT